MNYNSRNKRKKSETSENRKIIRKNSYKKHWKKL